MKKFSTIITLVILHALSATAQQLGSDLLSVDFSKREQAARALVAKVPLTAEAKTTLVKLFAREKGLAEPRLPPGARPGGGGEAYDEVVAAVGEAYGEYYSFLLDEVMKIADAEPDRTDVWRALLGAEPGSGHNPYGQWLGKHGDKTLPYLLAYANDHRTDSLSVQNRSDSLGSLAQIVACERQPGAAHHLSSAELQKVDSVIREALTDTNPSIRSAGVLALSIIRDPNDLSVLDNIALTDEDVTHKGSPTGTEIVFPIRDLARSVAQRVRTERAAGRNAK